MTRQNADKYIRIRDRNHHKKSDGFDDAQFDEMSRSYNAIRGREQQMIDYHGGAARDRDWRSDSQPGRSGNDRRGVSRDNKFRRIYHDAANREFGEKFWFTGQ